MIVRTWRTHIDGRRADEYDLFASTRSLPMFRRQAGFSGVLFSRTGDSCAVVTFWENREAIEELERSPGYRETVAQIVGTGFLVGDQSVEVLDLVTGELSARLVNDFRAVGQTDGTRVRTER